MKRKTSFSKLLIVSAIVIVLSACSKEASVEQYTGSFRFSVHLNRFDYTMLRTLEDTTTTFDGYIYAYQTGDYMRDGITPASSDIHEDHRLTIEFDSGKIITPVVTDNVFLSSAVVRSKFSLSGQFRDPDNVYIEIMSEAGHAYTARYKITGKRLK